MTTLPPGATMPPSPASTTPPGPAGALNGAGALHVLFQVAGASYVIPAKDVVHMDAYEGATKVPGTPPWVAGLVQIRGRVLPVVDLRARFGLGAVEAALGARVVVVAAGDRHVGLLVDSAREVVRIDEAAFQNPPDVVAGDARGYVDAIAQAGGRLVMRVDPRRVVGDDKLPSESPHAQR